MVIYQPRSLLERATALKSAMCKRPLELHTEAAFRVQLARSTLHVDTNPSSAKVDELYGLLLAEMENLSHSPVAPKSAKTPTLAQTNVNPTTTPTPPPPKPNQTPQAKAKSDTPCRNFLTDAGCSRGAKRGFSHDTSSLTRAQRGQRCSIAVQRAIGSWSALPRNLTAPKVLKVRLREGGRESSREFILGGASVQVPHSMGS